MFEAISNSFAQLNIRLVLLSAILFTLGLLLTDFVLERNIRWLISYPNWVYRKIENWLDQFSSRLLIFSFILVFNSLNMMLGFVSGFLVIVPFILVVWTGLNIGTILRQSIGEGSFWLIFVNPVSVFELPAAWISFSLGIEMGMIYLTGRPFQAMVVVFQERLSVFIWLVLPLLVIAGIIESTMIHFMKKQMQNEKKKDE